MKKKLRSGYTTGACASAAAKAAASLLLTGDIRENVSIPFPDRTRVSFPLAWSRLENESASAAVKKDAGDDPDITNGALIVARVRWVKTAARDKGELIRIVAGHGVGTVTKPGLAVAVGSPAINPVPVQMIKQAVAEALTTQMTPTDHRLEVSISVPDGLRLAEKTLNKRLGIIGGISILGTTGVVKPVSAEAWTATISTSLDVAQAAGVEEIILSTGRTSERSIQRLLEPPEEALVMMGDYLDYSLHEIRAYSFTRVHMAVMWAKLLKGAMNIPQTHVRHGVLELDDVYTFIGGLGVEKKIIDQLKGSNTARETLTRLLDMGAVDVLERVCRQARKRYERTAGIPVTIYLVTGSGEIVHREA